jgi:hypothetical protein
MKPAASWETRRRVFSNVKRQQVDLEPALQKGWLFYLYQYQCDADCNAWDSKKLVHSSSVAIKLDNLSD